MGKAQEFEEKRLRYAADRANLQTAADLDRFLAADPKTARDAVARERWRQTLQRLLPRLKD